MITLMKKKLLWFVIRLSLPLLAFLVRLLGRTIRWERRYDFERDRGKIYAIWHGNALGIALFGMDRGIYTMVSRFRDGDVASYILEKLGYKVVRGSSEEGKTHKGGRVALLKLIQAVKEGNNVAITVDGPKGPAFEVKEGVVFLAQKTKACILPAYADFDRFILLNTWDRFLIPLPFTKGRIFVGNPICVSEEDSVEEKVKEVEEELLRISSVGKTFPLRKGLSQREVFQGKC